jgi:hypothetical protein
MEMNDGRKRNGQTELGRGLVLLELVLPFRERERREDARDGSPLGDAEPRFGETRDASDDDDRDDESGGEQEPVPHCGRGEHRELLCVRLLPVRASV